LNHLFFYAEIFSVPYVISKPNPEFAEMRNTYFTAFLAGCFMMMISCADQQQKRSSVDAAVTARDTIDVSDAAVKSDDYEQNVPKELAAFIPAGYSLLDSASGDLDLDKLKDFILVIKKKGEDTLATDTAMSPGRPLLILTGVAGGGFLLKARNDKTVLCFNCGGVLGDPFMGVVIKNGYFSVEHYGGSSWRWTRIITYKYSTADDRWYLFKDGHEYFHAAQPDSVERTILTAKDFGRVAFEDFDIDKEL
jgi:hypothetical protein